MRKLFVGAVAASAALAVAVAGGATAQTTNPAGDATFDVTVKSNNAGTKKKPGKHSLQTELTLNRPGTTVEVIEVGLPQGLKFSGKGFKKCSPEQILTQGPESCPAGSKAGPQGTANALIEPAGTPLNLTVQPFVGGTNTFYFFVASTGIEIDDVLTGAITNGGRKLRITIPLSLRQPLQGLDATLTAINQTFSGKAGKNAIVTSTSCPKGGWKVSGSLEFATRSNGTPPGPRETLSETASCKK